MRFFSSILASLVQKASVSYYMACLESRPPFSSQAQAPERGHHHLANRPRQSAFPESSRTKSHLPISITDSVFSWPSAKGTFVFLRKGKNVPHRAQGDSVTHQVSNTRRLSPSHAHSWAGSNELSPSQLSPFIPTRLFISRISFFLNPLDSPPPHLKRSFSTHSFQKAFWIVSGCKLILSPHVSLPDKQ